MERRTFIKICSSLTVLLSARPDLLWGGGAAQTDYKRVELVDGAGQLFRASAMTGNESFIFHYPFQSTPALLFDLGHKVEGGVGPSGGIVAFTSICSHQFSYPTATLSAINYHPGKSSTAGREQAISCCLHGSAFDPAAAGKVLAGPALKPLTAIVLEYNAGKKSLAAVGTRGPEIYPEFFKAFKRELRDQYGRSGYKEKSEGRAKVVSAAMYSAQHVNC